MLKNKTKLFKAENQRINDLRISMNTDFWSGPYYHFSKASPAESHEDIVSVFGGMQYQN